MAHSRPSDSRGLPRVEQTQRQQAAARMDHQLGQQERHRRVDQRLCQSARLVHRAVPAVRVWRARRPARCRDASLTIHSVSHSVIQSFIVTRPRAESVVGACLQYTRAPVNRERAAARWLVGWFFR